MYSTETLSLLLFSMFTLMLLDTGQMMSPWKPRQCPAYCSCLRKTSRHENIVLNYVDCTKASLTKPPVNLSINATAFDFTQNRIQRHLWSLSHYQNVVELTLCENNLYELKGLQFRLEHLRILDLSRNDLDYISSRVFNGFGNLSILILSENRIESLHKEAFVGLKHLDTLKLSRNRLYKLEAEVLMDLKSLRVLDLSHNNIHTLSDNNFRWVPGLKQLIFRDNVIKHIDPNAFAEVTHLDILDFSTNFIAIVPTKSLKNFHYIGVLDLSNNHISKLGTGSFSSIKVSELRISQVSTLQLVDRHAFINLEMLETLSMFGNRALMFVDKEAFYNVPKLEQLWLQGNNMSSFHGNIVDSLPSLQILDFRDNPIHCDCNIHWMLDYLHNTDQYNLTVTSLEEFTCAQPSNYTGFPLRNITDISKTCPPRILPYFPRYNYYILGHPATFHCRAVGQPAIKTFWKSITIGGHVTILHPGDRGGSRNHITVDAMGSLYLVYLKRSDQGTYICVASNAAGTTQRLAYVRVKNLNAHVITKHVTSHTITVTWANTQHASNYELLFRQRNANQTYHEVKIGAYMRTYTANSLLPHTYYDFCIAVKHKGALLRVNCTVIKTLTKDDLAVGLINARDYIIGGTLGLAVTVFILICLTTFCVQKYNRKRKLEEELYGDNMSNMFMSESMSDMTPITYENKAAELYDDEDVDDLTTASVETSCSQQDPGVSFR